jgi:hypothetical protein
MDKHHCDVLRDVSPTILGILDSVFPDDVSIDTTNEHLDIDVLGHKFRVTTGTEYLLRDGVRVIAGYFYDIRWETAPPDLSEIGYAYQIVGVCRWIAHSIIDARINYAAGMGKWRALTF